MQNPIERQMVEICPFHIGDRVRVKSSYVYACDWQGVFVIIGLRWEYQRGDGRVNVEIASDDEITRGYGATDGFRVDDLEPEWL